MLPLINPYASEYKNEILLSRWQTVYYAICRCDCELVWDAMTKEVYREVIINSPEELTTLISYDVRGGNYTMSHYQDSSEDWAPSAMEDTSRKYR